MTRINRAILGLCVALLSPSLAAQSKTYTNGENNAAAVDTTGDITLTVDDAHTATQSGVISGSGSLTKTGSGTLGITANQNNPYTGGTTISGGTLQLNSSNSNPTKVTGLGTGAILVNNGGTLSWTNLHNFAFDQAVTVDGPGSSISASAILQFGFTGTGSLTVTNGGSVSTTGGFTIARNSTFTGEVGSVSLSGSGTSLTSEGNILIADYANDTGSLTASDNATLTANHVIFLGANGTLTLGSGAVATAVGGLHNEGTVNLNAGGTLRTSGTNTGTGTLHFAGGTLQANTADFSATNLATLASGFTNTLDTNSHAITWNGVISGSGNLTKAGAGTLTLAAVNTYTGDTIISAGTLTVAADNATQTYAGAISGAGNLGKAGSSTVTLTGDNTYSGSTALDAGTLVFADRGAFYGGTLDATTAGQLTVASGATAGFGVGGSGYFSESDLGTLLTHATFAAGARLGLDTTGATAGTFTLSGNLTDTNSGANTLGLDKLGSGNLTLNGANTYTGGTVVHAGTLTLGHTAALGATTANLTLNGGTLDLGTFSPTVGTAIFNGGTFNNGNLNNAAAFEVQTGSLAANLGGNAALTKTGTGTFTLSGDNTYTGSTTVSSGILTFADRGAYYGGTLDATTAAKLSVASGATAAFGVGDLGYFSTTDLGVIMANASFAGGSSLGLDTTNATAGTFTWADAATGTLNLVKQGTGTLALTGTSSGTGNLTVNEGTLRLEGNAAAFTYATLAHTGTVDFAQSNEVTVTGNETGTGALTISGGGTVTIAGNLLTGTGDLTISHGTLSSPSGSREFARDITVTGADSTLALGTGALRFGTSSGAGSLLVSNGGTVTYASTGNATFNSIFIGNSDVSSGSITVTGTGSTFTTESGIRIGSSGDGTLNITDGGVFNGNNTAATQVSSLSGTGVINLSGTGSQLNLAGQLTVGSVGVGTVNLGSGATLTADRLLLASGADATGTLNLNPGGTLIVSDANGTALSSGSGTATFNFAGGTLKSNGTHGLTVSSNSTLAAGTTSTVDTNGQSATWSGILSGSGALTKAGAGNLTLTNANTYTGDTTISAGTLNLGHAGALQGSTLTTATGLSFGSLENVTLGGLSGSQNLALTNGSTAAVALTVGANDANTTYSGALSGAGSLIKSGTGTFTLTGDNTHSGGTTVSAGTLQIGDGSTTGSLSGNITNDATLAFHPVDAQSFTGVISGSGALTKAGAETLTLTQDNTYTGTTTIATGTLQLGTGGSTGSLVGNVANSGTLIFNRSLSQTYNGVISGTGSVISDGGVVAFSAAQTYTGNTAIKSGAYIVLATTVNQGLAASTHVDIESGGTLDISNHATTVAGLTGAGNVYSYGGSSGHLTVNTADEQNQTFSGVLGSTYPNFALTKTGAGTLTLTGANTYTGGTTVSAGTLVGTTTSLQGNITNNAAVVFEQDSVDTYSGTISGSGTLTKTGTGTLYLNAANTYTGATTINEGTLRLGEALPFASTSITVASDASLYVDADSGFTLGSTQTLGGTGSITGGLLTVASGATLNPGNSPGTLTFTSGLTLDAGAILNFELGTVSDLIAITGGVLTGPSSGTVTLNLSDAGDFTAGTYTLFDYTAATLSSFDATDFTLGSTITGYDFSLDLFNSTLRLTAVSAVPEPSTYAAILGLGTLGFVIWRKRRR